jgi:Na+/H+ antiporter NhaD/arsenite permease-like protein
MSSQDYVNKITELRQKVGEYGNVEKEGTYGKVTKKKSIIINFISKTSVQTIIYIAIPIVVVILLYIIKPSILTEDNIDKDNNITKKIVWKKFCITTVVMSLLIIIPLFVYFYKKK